MKKIAIVGPESTGKSSIAKSLAKYFATAFVPEFSRYYCKDLNRVYTLEDEINMFHGQMALEEAVESICTQDILICDTTIMTIKIWSDYLFGGTPSHVVTTIRSHHYDLYLLMDIDLPWEDDPLRDFPNERPHFMEVWKKELQEINANFRIITGIGASRQENSVRAVEEFLENKISRNPEIK